MAYFITPDLGLELADPLTIQSFETPNVNSNFLLLEAGIVADRVRLLALETDVETLQDRVTVRVADFTALASAATGELLSGDLAYVTEGQVIMAWSGSAWFQVNTAKFASTAARDSAYAKASGAYLVNDVKARVARVDYHYVGAWLRIPAVIKAGTFTAVSSFNIDNLEGYDEYRIVVDAPICSAINSLHVRFLNAGVADSSAQYDWTIATDTGAAGAWAAGVNQTFWSISPGARADKEVVFDIFDLNATKRTRGRSEYRGFDAATNFAKSTTAMRFEPATAFTGIQVTTLDATTVTGSYYVQGVA